MSTGPVQLCNRALTMVGGATITALTDSSKEGILSNLHYAPIRDEVMQTGHWSFARARFGPLTHEVTPPAFEFSGSHLLPSDSLRVVWAGTDQKTDIQLDSYEIEDNKLLADVTTSSIYIKYIKQVTDTTKFSPLFDSALSMRLAAELAIPVAEGAGLANTLFQKYLALLDRAEAMDGRQGRNQVTTQARHIRARWSQSSGGVAFSGG